MKKVPGIEAICGSQSWQINATGVTKTPQHMHALYVNNWKTDYEVEEWNLLDAKVEPNVGKGMSEVRTEPNQ